MIKEHVSLANALFAEGITASEEQVFNIIKRMEQAKYATQISTSVDGLTITIGDDGLWLNFETDKTSASINLSLQVANPQSGINQTILNWCKDTAKKYC